MPASGASLLLNAEGLVAGPVNLALALALGARPPSAVALVGGRVVGVLSYGVSLVRVLPGTRHRHPHHHGELVHSHAHYPDAHHQHDH